MNSRQLSYNNNEAASGSGLSNRNTSKQDGATFTPGHESILVGCQHCDKQVSSKDLDTHENQCAESLSINELQKMQEIPQTKIISTELNQIRSHDSSENEDDFASGERTPSRNKLVHDVPNSFSEKKVG